MDCWLQNLPVKNTGKGEEVVTSSGKQKIVISKTPVTITSTSLPILDQDVYYLKKVIVE